MNFISFFFSSHNSCRWIVYFLCRSRTYECPGPVVDPIPALVKTFLYVVFPSSSLSGYSPSTLAPRPFYLSHWKISPTLNLRIKININSPKCVLFFSSKCKYYHNLFWLIPYCRIADFSSILVFFFPPFRILNICRPEIQYWSFDIN